MVNVINSIFSENGQRNQHVADVTTSGKPPVIVYGESKLGIPHSDDQPPPTYELALKMLNKECSVGGLPNGTLIWTESDVINIQQLPNSVALEENISNN